MLVYRIAKTKARATDLSGLGSFTYGGRWNSKGVHMLYTSQNSSLAMLESLVHFDRMESPPSLFIAEIELTGKPSIYLLKDSDYPDKWHQSGLIACRETGDQLMKETKYLAIQVRSAINEMEFNYLLNPLHADFTRTVKVKNVKEIKLDERLV